MRIAVGIKQTAKGDEESGLQGVDIEPPKFGELVYNGLNVRFGRKVVKGQVGVIALDGGVEVASDGVEDCPVLIFGQWRGSWCPAAHGITVADRAVPAEKGRRSTEPMPGDRADWLSVLRVENGV